MKIDASIPPRALRTVAAAKYLGLSPSLIRKMRSRGPSDPLGPGPKFIRVSPALVLYDVRDLDEWLNCRRECAAAADKAETPDEATASRGARQSSASRRQ